MAGGTTCVVADDHPAIVAIVRSVLERDGLDVVATARDGAAAAACLAEHRPALAVLDVRMPERSGIEVAREAARTSPGTRIVLFTAFGERATLMEAIDLGVRGFLLKDAPLEELARAIRTVEAGGTYVDPSLAALLVRGGANGSSGGLSDRERAVLRLVADGLSNDRIAAELEISTETVRTHVRNAMAKLDADNRTHAVASALRASVID